MVYTMKQRKENTTQNNKASQSQDKHQAQIKTKLSIGQIYKIIKVENKHVFETSSQKLIINSNRDDEKVQKILMK